MANKEKAVTTAETKKIVFYCYYGKQYNNATLVMFSEKWRFNSITQKHEIDDATQKIITFENWVYATEDKEEIEYLEKYNSGWTLLSWRILKPTPFPIVAKHKLDESEAKIIEKEVIVNKLVIPASILKWLDEATIVDMAKNEFDYEITSEKKNDMIKELTAAWFVS